MKLNIATTPKLKSLTINGILEFDPNQSKTILQSEFIWVKYGELRAGTSDTPFPNEI